MTSIYFTPEMLTPEGFEDPFDPTDPRPPGHVLAYALNVSGAEGRSSGSNASPMTAPWPTAVATGQKSKREAKAG